MGLSKHPLLSLLSVFYRKSILTFVTCFSVSTEMTTWFLSYIPLLYCIVWVDFCACTTLTFLG